MQLARGKCPINPQSCYKRKLKTCNVRVVVKPVGLSSRDVKARARRDENVHGGQLCRAAPPVALTVPHAAVEPVSDMVALSTSYEALIAKYVYTVASRCCQCAHVAGRAFSWSPFMISGNCMLLQLCHADMLRQPVYMPPNLWLLHADPLSVHHVVPQNFSHTLAGFGTSFHQAPRCSSSLTSRCS